MSNGAVASDFSCFRSHLPTREDLSAARAATSSSGFEFRYRRKGRPSYDPGGSPSAPARCINSWNPPTPDT
jgi:hypothetical protein